MRIAIASFDGMPAEFRDDQTLLGLLAERGVETTYRPWDDPSTDWQDFELVVARTPWDYTWRLEQFLAWTEGIGEALENAAPVIRWNSDKRYLADLSAAGLPVVETTYVEPGESAPPIRSEVVIKPAVSGGARNTGRFGPGSADAAAELIERIGARGGTAMIQPFVASVESEGETAVVTIDGEVSHVLRKRSLLAADEVAPVRTGDALGVAEVMYDPDLVLAGEAAADELELATAVLADVRSRFGVTPLFARVDMLRAGDGSPVLLELEAIEPNLYFDQAPGAAERLADAIISRARASSTSI
jgi:hypothetical protein